MAGKAKANATKETEKWYMLGRGLARLEINQTVTEDVILPQGGMTTGEPEKLIVFKDGLFVTSNEEEQTFIEGLSHFEGGGLPEKTIRRLDDEEITIIKKLKAKNVSRSDWHGRILKYHEALAATG